MGQLTVKVPPPPPRVLRLQRAFDGKNIWKFKNKSGEIFDAVMHASKLRDSSGATAGFICVITRPDFLNNEEPQPLGKPLLPAGLKDMGPMVGGRGAAQIIFLIFILFLFYLFFHPLSSFFCYFNIICFKISRHKRRVSRPLLKSN
jgi:hypothetical protein